jgi:hypothetical protein
MQLHLKDGRRRMSDLADALLLSRGGATRLVAPARRTTACYPAYLEIVQRLFHDFVVDEAEVLVRVWNRVLEGNGMACAPVTHAAEALKSRRVAT